MVPRKINNRPITLNDKSKGFASTITPSSLQGLSLPIRQLRLSETAEELFQLLREAEKASWTYLESITGYELAKREAKSLEKRMKWARFPYVKSLDEFELKGQNVLTARQLS
jgi:DNA replication protein DnaC